MQTKRYVQNVGMTGTINKKNKGKAHGPPHKILRHMPIIPRIQRLFHCKQLVVLQGWHASHRSEPRSYVNPNRFNSHEAYRGYMAR
jgi:hypothetical protein